MIVVTDASPLRYLIVLGFEFLLPRLYHRVLCPMTVLTECMNPGTPQRVKDWTAAPPEWLVVVEDRERTIPSLASLDPGEQAAIELALGEQADAVLIDEAKGRREARNLGLMVVGTIGILSEGARNGWVDYDLAVARLMRETNFRATPGVIALGRRHATGG